MWLKLRFSSINHYFCVVYRSTSNTGSSIFDLLSSNIVHYYVRNREWPVHSSDTSVVGHETEKFAVINNLSQPIDLQHTLPDRISDHAHILDFVLTSILPLYSNIFIHLPLVSSDHCVITSFISTIRPNTPLLQGIQQLSHPILPKPLFFQFP